MKPKMQTITILYGASLCQIDDFAIDDERSVKGALHIFPGTIEITNDELNHIKKKYVNLYKCIVVIPNKSTDKKLKIDNSSTQKIVETTIEQVKSKPSDFAYSFSIPVDETPYKQKKKRRKKKTVV